MMEGGMQSADEALTEEDIRTLRTSAALTGGIWENTLTYTLTLT